MKVSLRYIKGATNVVQFKALQFGVCFFEFDADGTLVCHPFNVDLAPVGDTGHFLSDGGALSFLTRHAFDFNELYYAGLSNTSLPRMQETTKILKGMLEIVKNVVLHLVDDKSRDTLPNNGLITRIDENTVATYVRVSPADKHALDFVVDACNAAVDGVRVTVDDCAAGVRLVAARCSSASAERVAQAIDDVAKSEVFRARLYSAVDFRKVTEGICEFKVPLVLHNGFNDLMHVG